MNALHNVDLQKPILASIVAGLFALLGLTGDSVLGRIPIELHRNVRRVLRPAESAARRLIVVMAMFVKVKPEPSRAPRPIPKNIIRTGQAKPRICFRLFDPRPRIFQKRRPKNVPRRQPSITFFSNDGSYRRISLAPPPPPPSDGLENSAHLVRRLHALKAALDDLPRQAKRLARTLARRRNSPDVIVKLKTPLRPGRPPGHRKKPRLEIDHVLRECEWLGRNVLPPDSS